MSLDRGSGAALRTVLISGLAIIATFSAAGSSEHPRWAVLVASGKGESYIDEPACHHLEYFSGSPQRFDYASDLFGEKPEGIKDKVHSERVGEVAGYEVHQVTHDINDGELVMKMILVRRKGDDFCEIYHQQYAAAMVAVQNAFFVQMGGETLLATSDAVSGNGAWREEHYWTFDQDGPIELHVWDTIFQIQKRLLPAGFGVVKGGGFDLRKLTYSTPVWKDTDGGCCPSGGTIEIKFILKNHHLAVVSQKYDAN